MCMAGWPQLNELIHLKAFPDDSFRYQVMTMVLASIVGTFVWDRLMTAIFAPNIFKAMLVKSARLGLSLTPMVVSLIKVFGGLILKWKHIHLGYGILCVSSIQQLGSR